ncbi:efflux RND transporter periplasmic adaptor subunit [Brevundimonas sp.]|uniref:efflux RND transporter periplasmic adaptor subunit n=1 Tax=Brevundimonas sp. TaxID=1871086 RepID=UPI003563A923
MQDRTLEEMLGVPGAGTRKRPKAVIVVAVAVAAVAAAFLIWRLATPAPTSPYQTQLLTRGDLVATVSATGTVAPLNQVEVGSELSGAVERVMVEENDVVVPGQVLATLDATKLRDQIAGGEAAVAVAQAQLREAQATVRETGLRRTRLSRLWTSSNGGYPARADVDAAEAAAERALASAASATAGVRQAEATLRTHRTNLEKSTIRSPIGGVILDRQVEPGQTVAASLQAPVLFVLAEDLSRMNLEIDIDEAEVAAVREAQSATFTVDAFPGRAFEARVTRVGLGSQTKEGVVTYTALLSVDNADLSLRPGMTATAEITTLRREKVFLVPEQALRFSPPSTGAPSSTGLAGALSPRMPGGGGQRQSSGSQIWVLRDGVPVRIPVTAGASNGQMTEVSGAGLSAGMAVIVGGGEDAQ